MNTEEFRELVFSFPCIIEKPHFNKTAFKAGNKRIFATLDADTNTVNLKLEKNDQATFSSFNKPIIYPVPNKWGRHGWTTFELNEVPGSLMLNALETAYNSSLK